jgi:pilus assembly protein Flp/PilA
MSFPCADSVREAGATAIEYGLIAALISVMIIVAVTVVGTVNTTFNAITTTTLASPRGPKSRRGPGPTASRREKRLTVHL